MGIDRGTVAKYLAMDEIPEKVRRKLVSLKIEDFRDYMAQLRPDQLALAAPPHSGLSFDMGLSS
jgi:hypothetical protein